MAEKEGGFLPIQKLVQSEASRPAIREEETRARLIAADRLITGASLQEIARSYGIGTTRVKRALSHAERIGFYEDVEAAILERLVPKALAVYEAHLDRGSLDAARDVAYGVGVLRKNPEVSVNVGASDSLESYRLLREIKNDQRNVLPAPNGESEGKAGGSEDRSPDPD